jgi:LysM repeat protein
VYYGKSYSLYESTYSSGIDLKNQYLTLILKLLLIAILIGIIYFGYLYLSNMRESALFKNRTEQIMPIQPQCVTELTAKDITKIVSIVVEKLQKEKKKELTDSDYSKELLKYRINSTKSRDIKGVDIYIKAKDRVDGENINRTNRVLIEDGQRIFTIPLDDTIIKDNYTKSIEKELESRKNAMKIIVVRKGDNLSKIAKRAYGDSKEYIKILKANPHILKNPNLIYVGQKLRIPLDD